MMALRIKSRLWIVCAIVLCCSCSSEPTASSSDQPEPAGALSDRADPAATPGKNESRGDSEREATDSPESALRVFLVAMISGDSESLKSVAVPHDEIDILLAGTRAPAEFVEQAKRAFSTMVFERLSVGDEVKLPSGTTFVLDDSKINDDCVQITFPNNPLPFEIVRRDGAWKVNPESIIVFRKAAMEMRNKNGKGGSIN